LARDLVATQLFYVFDHLLGQARVLVDRDGGSGRDLALALVEESGALEALLERQ
jgi:hypothetical protein